jgi:hypothetical protein
MTERKFQVGDVVEILWVPGFEELGQDFVKEGMPNCFPHATISHSTYGIAPYFMVLEDGCEFVLWAEGLRLVKPTDEATKSPNIKSMSVGSLEVEAHYLQQRLAEVHKEIFSRLNVEE